MAASSKTEVAAAQHCQACGASPLTRFVSCGQVVMWQCPRCELYQNGTLYSPEEYEGAYDEMYAPRMSAKILTAATRLNRVAAVLDTPRPHLLEIGCNLGATMEAARLRGWEVTGVDVSQNAVDACRERGFNCATIDGLRLPYADATFDVLTAWHVIEHVADVKETLAEWRRVLRPGGVMALETPDGSSPMVRRRGAGYRSFWRPEHTYVFAPPNLGQLVEEAGFELLIQPWIGRLQQLTPAQACYALGYFAVEAVKHGTGNQKAFQIFARRVETKAERKVG